MERGRWAWWRAWGSRGESDCRLRLAGAAGIISAFASHHSALIHVRDVPGGEKAAGE